MEKVFGLLKQLNCENRERKTVVVEQNLLKAYSEYSKSKSAMLIRSTALKEERDSEKAKMAETLLMEHFKKNNPDVRDMLRAADQNDIVDHWNDQLNEHNKLKQSEDLSQIVMKEMESDVKMYEDKQNAEIELKRLQAKEEHLAYLQKQLRELNNRENEAKRLAEKEKDLMKELARIDQLEQERYRIEEKCKRELYGRALLHQHQTALRKRSLFIQNELKDDLNWLNQLTKQETLDYGADIEHLTEYKTITTRIQKHSINSSYEASKLWAKREEEWRNETANRQKLLHEVIEDRRKQISDQLTSIQHLQQEELISTEELLEQIETMNINNKFEEIKRHHQNIEQSTELTNQIIEKTKLNQLAKNEIDADKEVQMNTELAYEEIIQQITSYQTKALSNLLFLKDDIFEMETLNLYNKKAITIQLWNSEHHLNNRYWEEFQSQPQVIKRYLQNEAKQMNRYALITMLSNVSGPIVQI
ncbi:putative meiosis-specific nuclear structural protein 1 [Schistosoma mansoni]|uniref:putative meiosis-specific nuclear structural protein 1 n=1 Tax=Schistosoma mansoni TaxID=6183 RepID=UPI00022DC164|nr:putative meiosis-specific nuclear structural protein 1 [Schistosoma mansoni]|eukprot:XP_018649714.1 putative meiosis-specific nuclear structural protein 1 [Schistosoma mansoni]